MNKKAAQNRLEKLREELKIYGESYYFHQQSLISDYQYDALYHELLDLENSYPDLITPDSPSQKIGARPDSRFQKVKHHYPMLSLNNAFNEAGLKSFDEQIRNFVILDPKHSNYVLEAKIDGLSISLIYEHGKLKQAVTRGNGIEGEDVTHNVVQIQDIPQTIPFQGWLEVRGEIYLQKAQFAKLLAAGLPFANPRNAASGTIRQLNSQIVASRQLSAFIYSIPNPLDFDLKTLLELRQFLQVQGFVLSEQVYEAQTIDDVMRHIRDFASVRANLPYETDGMVLKFNNILMWEEIGFTIKAPRFMIAYKFPETIVTSKLEEIFATVGRTGRITYNARVAKIKIDGTSVTSATLHNSDYIKSIKINVGDIVTLKKAGEIIPKILGVSQKNNSSPWEEATLCPSCQSSLVRPAGEVDQYCLNEHCFAKKLARFEHFVSINAFNVDELSTKRLTLFLQANWLTDFASLFELSRHRDVLQNQPGFGQKSLTKLFSALEKAKHVDLGNFLFALGIRHLGDKNAHVLATRFGSLATIMQANVDDFNEVRDFGPKVSQAIYDFFQNAHSRRDIDRLLEVGVIIKVASNELKSKIFQNQTFVITGTHALPRHELVSFINSHGGNVATSISKNTSYCLAGEDAGSKLDKAHTLKIKVIDQATLFKMIEGE